MDFNQIISNVLLYLIQAGVLVGMAFVYKLIKKGRTYLNSKLTESQRNTLNIVATDAVQYIEKNWNEYSGPAKYSQAVQHCVDVVNGYGLKLDTQDVQAAIQAAYDRAKQQNLVGNVSQTDNTIAPEL